MGIKWNEYSNEEVINMLKDVVTQYGNIKTKEFTKYGLPNIAYYSKILNLNTNSKKEIFKCVGIILEDPQSLIKKYNEEGNGIITDLPTMIGRGFHNNKVVIDWKATVGQNIQILYNSQVYSIKIMNYNSKKHLLSVLYDNNPPFDISSDSFRMGHFMTLLRLGRTKEYAHQVGDIIASKYNQIQIIEQIRINRKMGTLRGYKYKCLTCGNVDKIDECMIKQNKGCNVCCPSPTKTVKEINSVWKTNPELIKFFNDPKDAEKYSINSNKKIWFVCPRCGQLKHSSLNNMNRKLLKGQFPCERCGDTKSYPEKFMFNVLKQLDVDFKAQQKFKWSDNKIYDFYVQSANLLIETHGLQHYQETNIGRGTLQDEQENDDYKKYLALHNNIKNYITIDCRKSDLEFIKNNIINSRLGELFDLSKVDWLQCHEYACSSLVKVACDLWNSGIQSTVTIGEIIGLNRNGVCQYLKQGNLIGWCEYDPKESMQLVYEDMKNMNTARCGKPLICLENGIVFKSTADCSEKSLEIFNVFIRRTSIGQNCNGQYKTSRGYHFKYIQDLSDEEKNKYDVDNKIKTLYSKEELIYLSKFNKQ